MLVGERFGRTSCFWAVIKTWIWHANASQASSERRAHPDLLSVWLGHRVAYGKVLGSKDQTALLVRLDRQTTMIRSQTCGLAVRKTTKGGKSDQRAVGNAPPQPM